ncbi:tryptophan-rich sensory protein [Nonomuraea sp. NPDC050790]|uniref:tryptophan-rich sensory protein n=1 Tax=Nonomuraea sp. NPDC050790 TaxID=3364371 RepID=UPI00378D6686
MLGHESPVRTWAVLPVFVVAVALVAVVALLLLIVATIVLFGRIRRVTLLRVPYLLWVIYAAALNLAIWQLN